MTKQTARENKTIEKSPPPSSGETLDDLFRKLSEGGGKKIRNQIIEMNTGIVFPIAKKFKGCKETFEDLVQVGFIGLIKAVDNFDPNRGIKFITYASHCITGEIRHHLRDRSDHIKQPRWLKRLSSMVSAFMERYLQENRTLPSIVTISTSLNISEEGIIEILKAKQPISLDNLQGRESYSVDSGQIRSVRYENFRLPVEDRIVLEEAVEDLRLAEKKIIYLFFYHDLTQTQIAKNLGLSQKKVSRMLNRSIDKLRGMLFPHNK